MKTTATTCKALAAALGMAVCAMAHAADADSVLKVRIGDGLAKLGKTVQGLEPDVCSNSERSWYRSQGWSCDGYAKDGLTAGQVSLRARFRMAEPVFTVANVTLSGEVLQAKGDESAKSLSQACDRLMRVLEATYGQGQISALVKSPGSVRYVVFYDSMELGSTATLMCLENGMRGKPEVLITVDPRGQGARASGPVARSWKGPASDPVTTSISSSTYRSLP